ncbi:5,6-dimethylbenzimidazole synthase [Neptuniibacter caesariensis]|uniref:5,6-dimethylbenzimidazole synthase n=1 Tax=Neptuniibacter caesariensis TaxID=207954 RepID=A0A7U8C468_NEPCE|nr:5,6-dimethylbenzimidazole synthase [Neptuniibacter caesariensis]EAR59599.1 nitroreductase family protein [Oceanospirillum sp. MED92] [Neptuniibacter caesariensis]
MSHTKQTEPQADIDELAREHFYQVLYGRRDVRNQFLPDPVPDDVLTNILHAAHHAPSVGLSQPWNFILIRNPELRNQIYSAFCQANDEAAQMFEGDRRSQYQSLKLQGILDAPLNVCITCDRNRGGPVVLGKTHQPEMDLYSTVCAVQNFWLSARAENVGVGWVSIINKNKLAGLLKLPEGVVPVAYLCVGYVSEFLTKPELELSNWEKRKQLEEMIFDDTWANRKG